MWILLVYIINQPLNMQGTNAMMPALMSASFHSKSACEAGGKWIEGQRQYARGNDVPRWVCLEDGQSSK